MDNLVWIIYFIDVLTVGSGVSFISFILVVGYLIGNIMLIAFTTDAKEKEKYEIEEFKKNIHNKKIGFFVLMFFLYAWLMPSKDTAYKMLAAYGVTEIAKNEQVQELGGKSLEVLNAAMDDYLGSKKDN